MNAAARALIAALDLAPLPAEGGFFRATWRNATGSAIYFLLTADDFSALHRLEQDEIWHFHAGDRIEHVQLDPRDGTVRVTVMSAAVLAGDQPQVIVPGGCWQGARLAAGATQGYALVGCTVSPPWDERGFELARRADLLRAFPAQGALIAALTR